MHGISSTAFKVFVPARCLTLFILFLNLALLACSAPMGGAHLGSLVCLGLMAAAVLFIPRVREKHLLILVALTAVVGLAGVALHLRAGVEAFWPLALLGSGAAGLGWLGGRRIKRPNQVTAGAVNRLD